MFCSSMSQPFEWTSYSGASLSWFNSFEDVFGIGLYIKSFQSGYFDWLIVASIILAIGIGLILYCIHQLWHIISLESSQHQSASASLKSSSVVSARRQLNNSANPTASVHFYVWRSLYTISMLISSVLFVPMFGILFGYTYTQLSDTSGATWKAALVAPVLLLFIMYSLAATALLYDNNPMSTNSEAMPHAHTVLLHQLVRMTLVIIVTTSNASLPVATLICILVVATTISFMRYLPYYSMSYNQVRIALLWLASWTSVMLVLTEFINGEDGATSIAVMLYLPTPALLVCAVLLVRMMRVDIQRRSLSDITSPYQLELKARFTIQSAMAGTRPGASQAQSVSHTPATAHGNGNGNGNGDGGGALYFLRGATTAATTGADGSEPLYQKAVALAAEWYDTLCNGRFRNMGNAHLFHALLHMYCSGNIQKALTHLFYAAEQSPRFDEYMRISFLIEAGGKHIDSLSDSQVLKYIKYQTLLSKAMAYDEATCRSQADFWNATLQHNPDLEMLHRLGVDINTKSELAQQAYDSMLHLSAASPGDCRKYGSFLLEVQHNAVAADVWLRKADLIEHTRAQSSGYSNQLAGSNSNSGSISLLDERNGILTASGHADFMGRILHINDTLCSMLQYSPSELIGENLAKIIPQPFAASHDRHMWTHLQSGHSNVLNMVRFLFVLNKNGYLVPILLNVMPVLRSACTHIDDTQLEGQADYTQNARKYGMAFVAAIKEVDTSDNFMIIDCSTGMVQHWTTGCLSLFEHGQELAESSSSAQCATTNKAHVSELLPSYEDDRLQSIETGEAIRMASQLTAAFHKYELDIVVDHIPMGGEHGFDLVRIVAVTGADLHRISGTSIESVIGTSAAMKAGAGTTAGAGARTDGTYGKADPSLTSLTVSVPNTNRTIEDDIKHVPVHPTSVALSPRSRGHSPLSSPSSTRKHAHFASGLSSPSPTHRKPPSVRFAAASAAAAASNSKYTDSFGAKESGALLAELKHIQQSGKRSNLRSLRIAIVAMIALVLTFTIVSNEVTRSNLNQYRTSSDNIELAQSRWGAQVGLVATLKAIKYAAPLLAYLPQGAEDYLLGDLRLRSGLLKTLNSRLLALHDTGNVYSDAVDDTENIPITESFNGVPVVRQMSLMQAMSAVVSKAELLESQPMSAFSGANEHADFIIRNNFGTLEDGLNNSANAYLQYANERAEAIQNYELGFTISAVTIVSVMLFCVLQPVVHRVHSNKSRVMALFLDVPRKSSNELLNTARNHLQILNPAGRQDELFKNDNDDDEYDHHRDDDAEVVSLLHDGPGAGAGPRRGSGEVELEDFPRSKVVLEDAESNADDDNDDALFASLRNDSIQRQRRKSLQSPHVVDISDSKQYVHHMKKKRTGSHTGGLDTDFANLQANKVKKRTSSSAAGAGGSSCWSVSNISCGSISDSRVMMLKVSVMLVIVVAYFVGTYVWGMGLVEETNAVSVDITWAGRRRIVMQQIDLHTEDRFIIFNPTERAAITVLVNENVDKLRHIHRALLFGDANSGVKGTALSDPRQRAMLFENACADKSSELVMPSDCETWADGLMTHGLDAAMHEFNAVASDLALNNNPALLGNLVFPQMSFMRNASRDYLQEALDGSMEIYALHARELVDDYVADRTTLMIVMIVVTLLMLVGFYSPLISKLEVDVHRTQAVLLIVPPSVICHVKSIQAFIRSNVKAHT
jgi:PAS domain S-box-containing protein